MNIFHPLSKFNFLSIWFIEEELVSIFTILVIILDVIYFYQLFPFIGEERKKALLPYYNWYLVYKRFWNERAFFEHLSIEIFGILYPLFVELIEADGILLILTSIIDLAVCVLGVRHHYEINDKLYEHFEMDRRYLPLCLVLDLSLLALIIKLKKDKAEKNEQTQEAKN